MWKTLYDFLWSNFIVLLLMVAILIALFVNIQSKIAGLLVLIFLAVMLGVLIANYVLTVSEHWDDIGVKTVFWATVFGSGIFSIVSAIRSKPDSAAKNELKSIMKEKLKWFLWMPLAIYVVPLIVISTCY